MNKAMFVSAAAFLSLLLDSSPSATVAAVSITSDQQHGSANPPAYADQQPLYLIQEGDDDESDDDEPEEVKEAVPVANEEALKKQLKEVEARIKELEEWEKEDEVKKKAH